MSLVSRDDAKNLNSICQSNHEICRMNITLECGTRIASRLPLRTVDTWLSVGLVG